MTRRFYKHKLLLDENMPHRIVFPLLNARFDVKHLVANYKQAGLADEAVYALAQKEGRLLITYNIKDFRGLAIRTTAPGVIGIPPHLSLGQIDTKLTARLIRATANELLGKLTLISTED